MKIGGFCYLTDINDGYSSDYITGPQNSKGGEHGELPSCPGPWGTKDIILVGMRRHQIWRCGLYSGKGRECNISETLELQGPLTEPDVRVVLTYLQNLTEAYFKLPLVTAIIRKQ